MELEVVHNRRKSNQGSLRKLSEVSLLGRSLPTRVLRVNNDDAPLDELAYDQRTGLWSPARFLPAISQDMV